MFIAFALVQVLVVPFSKIILVNITYATYSQLSVQAAYVPDLTLYNVCYLDQHTVLIPVIVRYKYIGTKISVKNYMNLQCHFFPFLDFISLEMCNVRKS